MADPSQQSPAPTPGFPRYDSPLERRTLRDYYIIIREHLWLALFVGLLVSVSIGYYLARRPAVYAATAQLEFRRPERVVTTELVTDTAVRSDADVHTYMQMLGTGRVRDRVLKSLTPEEVRLLQQPYLATLGPGVLPPGPETLISDVSIDPVRNSLLFNVTARAHAGEAAALIANRYIDEYIDFLIERSTGSNEDAVGYLERRSVALRKEYEESERALQNYKQRENLVSLDDSLNIINDRVKSINAALTSARLERLDLEVYRKQMDDFRVAGKNLFEIAFISNHGAVPGLKLKLDELLRTETVLNQRYLERHPRMVELGKQISSMRSQLDDAVLLAVADLSGRLAKTTANELSLTKEVANAESEALRLGRLAVEFKSLENQALAARSNYVSILDRLNQTRNSKNLQNIPVRQLDRASAPATPVEPNLRSIVKNCGLLFVVILLGLPLALNFIDDRIKSSWDVENFVGAHLLGIIPDVTDVKPEERTMLVTKRETTPAVEAFLSLYSAVKLQSKLDFPKTLMVTSTIPGEGKTMIACNLAAAFARHGKTVLLIDCDLRRPMMHRHFDRPNDQGVIPWAENGYFLGEDPFVDQNLGLIRVAENFHLLRAGGRSKTPTAILEHPSFAELLESLKRRFDLVVVDTPPVGAVTDAMLIAERTDECVYVSRFNKAQRKHIRVYVKALKDTKNDFLGVVLNGMNPNRIEHYSDYRYYRSYKKYYGAAS